MSQYIFDRINFPNYIINKTTNIYYNLKTILKISCILCLFYRDQNR